MLSRDSLLRRRDEPTFRAPPPPPPPAATSAPLPSAAATAGTGKPAEGSKLIVGPSVKLKGVEISDCDTLVVEGHVESALDSRAIQIAAQGYFHGTAAIDIAEIHGRFEGEITARKQLLIHATGRVSGKIRYGKIMIEEGGEITGDIGALGAASAAPEVKRQP